VQTRRGLRGGVCVCVCVCMCLIPLHSCPEQPHQAFRGGVYVRMCAWICMCACACACVRVVGAGNASSISSQSCLIRVIGVESHCYDHTSCYGVATVSRIDEITSLFRTISSLVWVSFAKETYNFIDPTNQNHAIPTKHYASASASPCIAVGSGNA